MVPGSSDRKLHSYRQILSTLPHRRLVASQSLVRLQRAAEGLPKGTKKQLENQSMIAELQSMLTGLDKEEKEIYSMIGVLERETMH